MGEQFSVFFKEGTNFTMATMGFLNNANLQNAPTNIRKIVVDFTQMLLTKSHLGLGAPPRLMLRNKVSPSEKLPSVEIVTPEMSPHGDCSGKSIFAPRRISFDNKIVAGGFISSRNSPQETFKLETLFRDTC